MWYIDTELISHSTATTQCIHGTRKSFDVDVCSLVPNSVTKIFGFSLIRHEFSLTTVTKLLSQRHEL